MISRDSSVIPFLAAADLSGKEGYFVKVHTDNTSVTPVTAATDVPLGVVNAEAASGAPAAVIVPSGFAGTTRVKLSATPGAVVLGSYLVLTADGSVKLDPGSGARVRVARALEAGVAGERIEAVLTEPTVLA